VHLVIAANMYKIDYKSIVLEKIDFGTGKYGREKNATHRMNAHMDCVNFMSTREFCGREKLPKSIM